MTVGDERFHPQDQPLHVIQVSVVDTTASVISRIDSFILSSPNGISAMASLRARKPAISLDSTGTRATRGA